MERLANLESIHMCRHCYLSGLNTVIFIIAECIEGRYERWNITSCLSRKIRVNCPEVTGTTGSSDSFVDIAGSAVVGSNGKRPVTKDGVCIFEIFGRCVCRFYRIQTLVYI